MHIEMIAAASNLGGPKWNGGGMPNHLEEATSWKCSRPIGHAIRQPMMIEMSTAVWPMKPENMRVMTMIETMTAAASRMCEICPDSGFIVVAADPVAGLNSA